MLRQYRWLLAILLLGVSLTALAQKPAPDFTLPTLSNDGQISLSALKGRVVYVDFWATWCPPCRKSFPWMDEMQKRYAADGLTIVAISTDGMRELAERFIQQMKPGFIIAHDAKGLVSRKFKLNAMPTSYLIDRQGNIVSTHVGFRGTDKEKLERQIEALL